MKTSNPRVDKAIKVTKNLIEHLHAPVKHGAAPASSKDEFEGGFTFFTTSRGGLRLTGKQNDLYQECLESLLSVHGSTNDARAMSRDAVARLLRTTLVACLRPTSKPASDERAQFSRRLARNLRALRDALTATGAEWRVVVQVQGLGPRGLPFEFGGVKFEAGTAEIGSRVASRIADFAPTRRRAADMVERERATRQHAREALAEAFSSEAAASLGVRALDDAAAKHLGVERVRRTLDVLNFFAPFLDERPGRVSRAYLAPESKRTGLIWAAYPVEGEGLHWSERWPASNPHVVGVDLGTERARDIGMDRASALLGAETRSDLDDRVVNALAWAGRATVEPRRDQAFLLYAISLESLLTKPSARTGVTDRLRLRAAHLIGRHPETRQRVMVLMSKLYEIRSALVHSGDSGALTDTDLETIAELVDRALTGMLTDQRFIKMRDARDFDRWFDAQLLG